MGIGAGRGGRKPILPTPSLEKQHCESPSKAAPVPYCMQGDCMHVPCSVPQFPHCTLPLLPRGSSGLWSLDLLLNMRRVLHEYSQPNIPSPMGGNCPFFGCRNLVEPACREREQTSQICQLFSWVSSFCRGNTRKPTAWQQTRCRSRQGGCCPSRECCLFPPGLPGAQVASRGSTGFPMEAPVRGCWELPGTAESAPRGSTWVEAPRGAGRP